MSHTVERCKSMQLNCCGIKTVDYMYGNTLPFLHVSEAIIPLANAHYKVGRVHNDSVVHNESVVHNYDVTIVSN